MTPTLVPASTSAFPTFTWVVIGLGVALYAAAMPSIRSATSRHARRATEFFSPPPPTAPDSAVDGTTAENTLPPPSDDLPDFDVSTLTSRFGRSQRPVDAAHAGNEPSAP